MKVRAAVVAAALLTLAVAMAPVAGADSAPGIALPGAAGLGPSRAAAASSCVWHRHTKRFVKRVERNGEVRLVRRTRTWWTCDPAPPRPPARLGVQAFEFHFVLSRPVVAAGNLLLELSNRGEDPHNLNLQRQDSTNPVLALPETESLQRSTREMVLQPGTYQLWCSLPPHRELGMESTLLVEPAR